MKAVAIATVVVLFAGLFAVLAEWFQLPGLVYAMLLCLPLFLLCASDCFEAVDVGGARQWLDDDE